MLVAEVVVDVPAGARVRAERAAFGAGAQGLEIRDADTGAAPGRAQIVWWVPAGAMRESITRAVRADLGSVPSLRVSSRLVEASWLQPPRPRHLGDRFVVVGPDETRESLRGRIALPVEATLGFGDGFHPTTALCVQAMEEAMERLAPPARVLDVGTGTGILAIVAARLGAETIVATDIDPLALHAARANLARNGVRARVGRVLPRGRFELVVANLYFEPLLALVPTLAARVARTLVVSGFGVGSARVIADALRAEGLEPARARVREGFACVTATRPPTPSSRARRRA